MKFILSILIVWFSCPLGSPLYSSSPGLPVDSIGLTITTYTISVTNVSGAVGRIWVGIYEGEHDFLNRDLARLVYAEVDQTEQITIELPDMTVGKKYALAVFHDINDNGELDRNWMGLPSEPWAFSGEPKTRFRLPTFNEVSFMVEADRLFSNIRLRMY